MPVDEADPVLALAEGEEPFAVVRRELGQPPGEGQRFLHRRHRACQIALLDAHVADLVEHLRAAEELGLAELLRRHRREVLHRFAADVVEDVEPAQGIELFVQVHHHEADELLGLALPQLGALPGRVGAQREDCHGHGGDEKARRCRSRQAGEELVAQDETGQAIGEAGGVGLDHLAVEIALEVRGHGPRRGIALVGIAGGAAQDDRFELHRQGRQALARRRQILIEGLAQDGDRVLPGERELAGEQPVDGDPQAVDVRAAVDRGWRGAQAFRRDVLGRACDRVHCVCISEVGGEAEIGDEGLEVAVGRLLDEDVRRLDIAVQQAFAVGGVEPFGGLGEEPYPVLQRESGASLCQGAAGDVAHRDEGLAVSSPLS